MRRILVAWVLGGNDAYLARCLPIATRFRERAHAVAFAVRDTRMIAEKLTPAGSHMRIAFKPVVPSNHFETADVAVCCGDTGIALTTELAVTKAVVVIEACVANERLQKPVALNG